AVVPPGRIRPESPADQRGLRMHDLDQPRLHPPKLNKQSRVSLSLIAVYTWSQRATVVLLMWESQDRGVFSTPTVQPPQHVCPAPLARSSPPDHRPVQSGSQRHSAASE